MDGIKQRNRPVVKPVRPVRPAALLPKNRQLPDRAQKLIKGIGSLATKHKNSKSRRQKIFFRVYAGLTCLLFIVSVFASLPLPLFNTKAYALTDSARKLLPEQNPAFAELLKEDTKKQSFEFNQSYTPSINPDSATDGNSTPRVKASFAINPKQGMTLTDPVNSTEFKLTPNFKLGFGRKDGNQIMYPLLNQQGYLVYTNRVTNVKEDIILQEFSKDELEFEYTMGLQESLEARVENDGSIGVYGSEVFMGDVSTGTDADKELLQKARKSAEKNKLVFRIPAPFIIEAGGKTSQAKTWYSVKEDKLTIHTTGLKNAKYPLTIDPSVYVETASKLMRGNNETNVDFDVENELIQKGKTTGARFDSWITTLALPAARWNHATAVAGGYIYVTGGSSGSTNQTTVYWSKFNTSTNALESPNPGNGACTNWCTASAYDLPVARAGHSMVAYNGFLYVIGGVDGSNARTSTVYISKIGANGEPSLWHPTDSNKNNWVYWYTSSVPLTNERSYTAAAAYNNRLYLVGGQTNATPAGVDTVQYANINPTGTFSAWSTTGMVVPPAARHNHGLQIYNDRMYLIGGANSTTLQNTVYYIKLASDGTMQGSWTATTAFGTARMAWGGSFTTIWGGYLYISGGCIAINGSGYCTTIAGDVQLASINADGTITDWGTIASVTSARMGYGLVGWRNTLYGIGGCTAHNTTTGACTTTATLTQYGSIKTDGEASTVSNSVPSGTAPCAASTWTDCDMPPLGNGNGEGGRMSGGAVINNGFIYYIGGCQAVGNNSVCFTGAASKTSDTISYSAIAADGTLVRTASCSGTFYGSWCVDNTNTINGSTGLAAFAYTVFNNTIYVIGGTTGTDWQALVWRNPLNANGSLGTWTSQTFANLDLGNAKGYQYAFTRANPTSASTYPANLYVIGGCSGVTAADNGLDCAGTIYTEVYKCNITTSGALEEADANDCTTSGQVQLDSEPGTGGSQGLGVMAGTVYANYIYLIGGQSVNQAERGQVMYAKIDNNNNIVDVDGETVSDNIWETSANTISPVRRRGVAFGYNGYLYALAGYNTSGGGSLNDLLFAKVDVSDGSIGEFTESVVTVNARWDLRAIVNNGYVYTMGGCSVGQPPASCTSTTGTIQTFQLYNNYSGSPASYAASTGLFGNGAAGTQNRIGSSATVYNGYIYLAGGCISATDCTDATNDVQYAPIDATGTVGTWLSGGTLPAQRAWGKLVTSGGTLYYLGGQDDAADEKSEIYYTTGFSSGNPTWSGSAASGGIGDTTSQAAQDRTKLGASVWNDRIYVVGGRDDSNASTNTVFISPQLSSGGNIAADSWTEDTDDINVARSGHTTIAYANNLYSLGGYDGTNYLSDVQFTQINSDGTIDPWTYSTSLPTRLSQADGFAANGFMYLIGGRSADAVCESNTIVAPISANTTIASGNNPTGVGDWYETNVKYTGDRYGAAAVYNEGKAYLLGGGCGATTTYTGANRVVQTTLQSQPQVAKYSRMIDTDTDVFPTKWLMNGLDNSIGARWNMRYRSSTASTAAWGQETNYGIVTLGTPAVYTPKDSGGANTNFARYYYMSVNIDSSQAYGYPEDVARGPTVADLSLFFTSDPSKRLKHGKTFTGGEQQPLDTPF